MEYEVILEVANSCTVNIIGQIPTVLEKALLVFVFVLFCFIFKMVLLITRNQNLILLNNRQSCMSVLRGKMHTISLLVYAR